MSVVLTLGTLKVLKGVQCREEGGVTSETLYFRNFQMYVIRNKRCHFSRLQMNWY